MYVPQNPLTSIFLISLPALLNTLVTRHHGSRPNPSTLPSQAFFSSLPISTLNFLERSNFATKSREEKISFMKGLVSVLDRFSEGLRTRKILPSLLEEMKDTHLLPYILPNVFSISQMLTPTQFASMVLPSLKPLFAIKEPPQNMITLLDNLQMLQSKTEKSVFRERKRCFIICMRHDSFLSPLDVLPLVYNAMESEHAHVGSLRPVHFRAINLTLRRFRKRHSRPYQTFASRLITQRYRGYYSLE